jgi:DNA-binding beta-propeller fold protein YncE
MDSLAMGFGSLWVGVPRGADAGIHRVNPKTNEEVAQIPVSGSVFIADGSVWVQEWKANLLVRVDPKTNQVTAKIPVEWKSVAGAPISHGISPAMGSVWVLRKEGIVSRIDPETNQSLAEIRIGQRRMERLDLTNYYSGLVAGEGAVWITEHTTDGKLIEVETKTNQVVARIPVGYQAGSIAVGGGFVWVSVYYTNREGHLVLKIDPRTNQILGKIFLAGTQPLLHAGKDGLLAWGKDLRPDWTGRTIIWKIPY